MKKAKPYYSAYLSYCSEIEKDGDCKKLLGAISSAPSADEVLSTVRIDCRIEGDWIEMIESKCAYIEKAIAQNRQFIYREGEVEPIEKAKSVSRTSIEHLAKHSNLITREPEGDEITPDRILVTENRTNFAIYENKFLYFAICYIRDFIDSRYNAIVACANKSKEKLRYDKAVTAKGQKLNVKIDYVLESTGEIQSEFDKDTSEKIVRIENLQKSIARLFNSDLMRELSRVPMIQLPITRTNVLKMDTDFKETYELLDYLVNYTGKGYSVTETENLKSSLSSTVGEDYARVVSLLYFLTHMNGHSLREPLQTEYEAEQRRLADQAEEREKQRIAELKVQVDAHAANPHEYMMALEERNSKLEKDKTDLQLERKRNSELESQVEVLRRDAVAASAAITQGQNEIERVKRERDGAVERAQADAEAMIREQVAACEERIKDYDALRADLTLKNARIKALLLQSGAYTPENVEKSDKERIDELENEMYQLSLLFENEWADVKKRIRKRVLWTEVKRMFLTAFHKNRDK